mgnify:CR=1 FL=1
MNTFLGHLLHQRLGQARLHCLALGQALAQLKAQAAQLCDAGDDAGLFGEGWERHRCFNKNTLIQVDHGGTNRFALQVTP